MLCLYTSSCIRIENTYRLSRQLRLSLMLTCVITIVRTSPCFDTIDLIGLSARTRHIAILGLPTLWRLSSRRTDLRMPSLSAVDWVHKWSWKLSLYVGETDIPLCFFLRLLLKVTSVIQYILYTHACVCVCVCVRACVCVCVRVCFSFLVGGGRWIYFVLKETGRFSPVHLPSSRHAFGRRPFRWLREFCWLDPTRREQQHPARRCSTFRRQT